MRFRPLALIALVLSLAANLSAAEPAARNPFSFVVLGHVRGNDDGLMNPSLDLALSRVRKLKPDMIFLTGDMIYGGLEKTPQRPEVITRDWDRLDGALAQLGIPVYRVPGNHDIHDPITRDIYFARYGKLPRAFTYHGSRFLLLNSTFVPEGSEVPAKVRGFQPYLRGKQLDAEQVAFIRNELTGAYDNVFLFMHHILWWHEEEAMWWREVHPLLVGRNVRAIFGGDVGPRKFSHVKRDGIDYIQSSMTDIPMKFLRRNLRQRMVAQQFDNFLHVAVNGPEFGIEVQTIGELSLGQFTPESWREMHRPEPPEEKSILARVWAAIESPRRLVILVAMVICFLGGVAATLIWHRRKAA